MLSTIVLASTAFSRLDGWLEEPAMAPPAEALNPFAPLATAVCVPKQAATPRQLRDAVDWACKDGEMGGCDGIPADCHGAADKQDGKYTYIKYATWVFSKYFSKRGQQGGTCHFNGAAYMSSNPPDKQCIYAGAIPAPGSITPPEYQFDALMAETNACMDAADQAVWNKDGKTDFAADLSACGHQCLGTAGCTAKCIEKRRGYTEACSTCFGELTGCTKDNCMFDCMMDAQGTSCKTCVDAHCTPAFKTCSGLTPPSKALKMVEAETDACMDAADQAVWTKDGKADFAADLSACGHQCLGTAGCTAKCIEKRRGYTEACSTCFGELTGCTKDNCMFDCMMDAQGTSCKTCVDAHCTPAFKTCSGLTPPSKALKMSVE